MLCVIRVVSASHPPDKQINFDFNYRLITISCIKFVSFESNWIEMFMGLLLVAITSCNCNQSSLVYPEDFLTYFFLSWLICGIRIGKEVGLLCVIEIKLWLIAFPGEMVDCWD